MKRFVSFVDKKNNTISLNVAYILKVIIKKNIIVYIKDSIITYTLPINQKNIETLKEMNIEVSRGVF